MITEILYNERSGVDLFRGENVNPEQTCDAENVLPDSPNSSSPAPWFSMGLLFLAHFMVDSQISFLSPLLPLIREKFHLTLSDLDENWYMGSSGLKESNYQISPKSDQPFMIYTGH